MSSPLSFNSTEGFRKKLLVRNLKAYGNTNFTANSNAGTTEFSVADFSVVDTPSLEDIGRVEAKDLYKVNEFGPDGGYNGFVDININQGTTANMGEYDYDASAPSKTTPQSQKDAFIQNVYGPPTGFNDVISIQDVQRIIGARDTYYKFVASTYSPQNILLQIDPLGSDGLVSQDSELAQIAAASLKRDFLARIAQETYEETLARANFLPGNNPAYGPLGVLTGRVPLIEPNWQISVPSSIIGKGLNFISRITGVYSPFSWIPGDYFAPEDKKSFLNQAANRIISTFDIKGTLKLPENKSSSDIFLANSGGGTRQSLFRNLTFNDYRPDYKGNFIGEINLAAPTGNYYVGSRTSDPIDIVSPNNELPLDKDGNKIQTAVRGYGELGKLYENNLEFGFGLATTALYDDGGLQGGFTWISQQNSPIGIKLGQGGKPEGEDAEFNLVAATFQASQSTNYSETFREGSIMYDTQRLIDSAERLQGDARLQHVGNAINQVSKVFNDGYRELTKGSRVVRYSQDNGYEVGFEYCRVFTKDVPYYTTGDLQKRGGNIRDFDYSVLSNTYNLNIAPTSGNESTTLDVQNGRVKKYMFSLENLAWRTSNRDGFTYEDLPSCERGPNGGRIMWFPPYDLNVSEQVSARWTDTSFLGRPEPIYTYNNTTRTGNLSWTILVDNPSIMNLIVDRELEKISPDSKVTQIMDSFFAGCLTYDIYELAAKFPQFSLKDIYEIVETTQSLSDYEEAVNQIPQANPQTAQSSFTSELSQYTNLAFYYDHAQPTSPTNASTAASPFNVYYNNYIALQNTTYTTQPSANQKAPVQQFFNTEVIGSFNNSNNFITQLSKELNQGATINITISASASSPGSDTANQKLSERRADSVKQYVLNYNLGKDVKSFKQWNQEGKLNINVNASGELTEINGVDCSQNLPEPDNIYSPQAMGCRRAFISNVTVVPPVDEQPAPDPEIISELNQDVPATPQTQQTFLETNVKPDIAKRVLRRILSECSYFELMKEDSPFLYNSIKEKIKYFQPAFHSITPEGLNSRLTFLQQCMRPGDTIPTIQKDESGRVTKVYNDAFNTAFGAPPVCILRVGDFYHTKIIIDSLDIRYEPFMLDLNPEGIGVQPMLAKVSLSFKFIGGQGLKEPVAKLQNALSFNYYANTEMYDERADVTEDVKQKYNAQVLQAIENIIGFSSKDARNDSGREGGNTIGTVTSEVLSGSPTGGTVTSVTGQINYKQFFTDFLANTKNTTGTILGQLEEINNNYFVGGLRMFTSLRSYTGGTFGGTTSLVSPLLFGKPEGLESKIVKLFQGAVSDVENNSNPYLGAEFNRQNFKEVDIKSFKRTLTDLIVAKRTDYQQFFDTAIQTMVLSEQDLVRYIDKSNLITKESEGANTGSDGYILAKGSPVVYSITGTTEVGSTSTASNTLDEFADDFTTIGDNLQTFATNLVQYKIDLDDFNDTFTFDCLDPSIDTPAQVRFFMIFAKEIVDNSEEFIIKLTRGGTLQSMVDYITLVTNNLKQDYIDSKKVSDSYFADFKQKYYDKDFSANYGKNLADKPRNFNFSKVENNTVGTALQVLYANKNQGPKTEYTQKVKFN
jgi:outer membrane protein OmpA-like peptidoglycan-associated protein